MFPSSDLISSSTTPPVLFRVIPSVFDPISFRKMKYNLSVIKHFQKVISNWGEISTDKQWQSIGLGRAVPLEEGLSKLPYLISKRIFCLKEQTDSKPVSHFDIDSEFTSLRNDFTRSSVEEIEVFFLIIESLMLSSNVN